MLKISVTNTDETFELLDGITPSIATKSVGIITDAVYKNVKILAKPHRDTGVMETNIRVMKKGDAGLVWIDDKNMFVDWRGRNINYAFFVLFGHRKHTINPKNKRTLRFNGFNNFKFKQSTEHKGYDGDNFLQNAMQQTFNNIERLTNGI